MAESTSNRTRRGSLLEGLKYLMKQPGLEKDMDVPEPWYNWNLGLKLR